MDTQEILRKLAVVRKRPSRIADALREPRGIVVGGAVANRLGLQVARTVKDRLAWHARPTRITDDVRDAFATMDRDGVVVIPDFLPQDQFAELRAELARSERPPLVSRYRTCKFGENFEMRELLLTDEPHDYPAFMRIMRDNEFLLHLAAAVSRRRMTYRPHVAIFNVHKPEPTKSHTDLDYNQFLHADRHYTMVKAFFYLNDVDEGNAPYCYARGSHRVDAARLRYEYEYSLAYVRARSATYSRSATQLEMDRELSLLAEEYMKRIGAQAEPLVGKANTLIVSNNIGFHKRGEMRSERPRITVNIDYKYLESPAQRLYPILRHLYSV